MLRLLGYLRAGGELVSDSGIFGKVSQGIWVDEYVI